MKELEGIRVIPDPTAELLNPRQYVDYEAHREEFLRWSLGVGKDPERGKGYSAHTVKGRAYRVDKFYRWVWNEFDGYTTNVTHERADAFLKRLAYEERSDTDRANFLKALKMLFKWRQFEHGFDEWEPAISFSNSGGTSARDYLTRDERSKIREAALEYGSVPGYNNLSPEERDCWKVHLAQRFEKPKSEVTPSDWDRANGWKIPSLVWVSLDTGLRPIEVERATTRWCDIENGVLRIPKEESSKNRDNWVVSLQDRTASILERWVHQRDPYLDYKDTDALWLTREGNPYSSQSLRYLLLNLCDIADIPTENRRMSWYAIRHSVGTYMTREEDLAAAQTQLRHKSPETTMKYDQTPVEDRRDALDRMG